MTLSPEKKLQAIISEHCLDPISIDKVYKSGKYVGLYLTFGTKIKITKIPNLIRQIATLTRIRIISFKIGNSYDLLYDTDYDIFISYKVQQNLTGSTTRYFELPDELLLMHLKRMKGLNHEI